MAKPADGNNTRDDIKGSDESLSLQLNKNIDNRLLIQVKAPKCNKKLKRLPAQISCVIDISGSMSTNATVKDANGKEESHGLCILDLVKHSVKTIINVLNEDDYLSIISFAVKAEVVSPLLKMTKANKEKTIKALNKLSPNGATNLWDGLFKGLEQLRKSQVNSANSNSAVFVFTDGLPNVNPPKGELAMLEKYIDTHQGLPGVINTYGFGYDLDSVLLNNISTKGNGYYGFIPDSSLMGTVFVNSISNLLSNFAKDVVLKVETDTNKYDLNIIGGHKHIKTTWGCELHLGNVMYGQNKDIIIEFNENIYYDDDGTHDANAPDNMEVEGKQNNNNNDNIYEIDVKSLTYINLKSGKKQIAKSLKYLNNKKGDMLNEIHFVRLSSVDVINECMESCKLKDYNEAQKTLKDMIKKIKSNKGISKDTFVQDLLKDLTGQVFQAISREDWYNKWGKHYLLSLMSAHRHEYCNNFKDNGVQHYGGKLYKSIKDKADDIFIKMPAPEPEVFDASAFGGGSNYGILGNWGGNNYGNKYNNNNNQISFSKNNNKSAKYRSQKKKKAAPKINMKSYYNAGGGCFGDNCQVKMNDGSMKDIKLIKKDDVIYGGYKIKCVVKIPTKNGVALLNKIGNLYITEYHPILLHNKWVFPRNISTSKYYKMDYIYNFVLNAGHIINVNGVQCCTLGHGFNDNNVIKHEYFGTNNIINDLMSFNNVGWNKGFIQLRKDSFKRDPQTNMVVKIE